MSNKDYGECVKRVISRREFLIGGGAVVAAAALAACSPGTMTKTAGTTTISKQASTVEPASSKELTPKYGGTMTRIFGNVPMAVIGWPAEMANGPSGILEQCFDTLLMSDEKGNYNPWLAESYNIADDRKSITFVLKKGVKFHDGSDFNAEVVKWNLDNMIQAKIEPGWASVDLVEDYVIRVNLNGWTNNVLLSFADYPGAWPFMVSKVAFDKNGIDWMRKNPVGTGPFKFVSATLDVGLKTVRNPDYWQKGKPYLDEFDYKFISDPMTQAMVMKSGDGDLIAAYPKDAADYIANGLKVEFKPSGTDVLIPDTANANSPWANQKVREAVEYAIDREGIAKAFGYGFLEASYQIPPPGTLTYDPNFSLARKHDPEKAIQLLAEAGYPGGLTTTIIVTPFINRDIPVVLQDNLAKVNIKINLEFLEIGKFATYLSPSGTWENAALFTGLACGDAYCVGGLNYAFNIFGKSWLRSPELTQAWQTALSSLKPEVQLVRAVTDQMTKEASIIPVDETVIGSATRSDVMGYFPRFASHQYWEDFWLNK